MIRRTALLAAVLLSSVLTVWAQAQKPDYGSLDGRNYDPKRDPDIDMFIGNWRDNAPRISWGSLIERDILTKSAGDPLRPHTKGAVLTYINRLTTGSSTPEIHDAIEARGDQVVFYFDKGTGVLSAGAGRLRSKAGYRAGASRHRVVMMNTVAYRSPCTSWEPLPAGSCRK